MKKNLGSMMGLYPAPVTVIGTVVDGRVNWVNIAHVGVIGVDRLMVSMGKSHYSNVGIRLHRMCSVNLVSEAMIQAADYVGLHSGKTVDKSEVFAHFFGELAQAPLIEVSPVAMACVVEDIYETLTHDNFILRPVETYVESSCLTPGGAIDFERVRPVLFEMGSRRYLETGKVLGKAWQEGKAFTSSR